ncbi:MAG: B12-binding domain-containing radical SAM protein [Planctomycetota bacterium]
MTAILLVNPPIYDFSAYDFWLRPYGLLRVAGFFQHGVQMTLFDFLDRSSPQMPRSSNSRTDPFGRGAFYSERIPKPPVFADIPRYFKRLGIPRDRFRNFLTEHNQFDFALIQTSMTYWYPGVKEVIEDIRKFAPRMKIILGGVYASLCPHHAHLLGPDLVVQGISCEPLSRLIDIKPDLTKTPFWQAYPVLPFAVLKISQGCPFNCTYCSTPLIYPRFSHRPLDEVLEEFELLSSRGVKDIAFYDDALLFKPQVVLIPFLEKVLAANSGINFHTPNALHACFITKDLAALMVRAGFKTFYLGFESANSDWQKRTGSKVYPENLAQAVRNLLAAGADPAGIKAYQIIGHPLAGISQAEQSMKFINSLGIGIVLADFSPIPGTPDAEAAKKWTDIAEPLNHNKTAFTIRRLGYERTNDLKNLRKKLNRRL